MDEGMLAVASEQANAPAIEQQKPETVQTDEPIDLDAPQEPEEGDGGSAIEGEGVEGEAAEGAEPEAKFAQIEFNGKMYDVPEELKSGFMMHGDYTKKTQEVAEMRRGAEVLQADARANFNVSQEVLQARAHLLNIDAQLMQFQNVNWRQFEAEDPIGAMSAHREFQDVQAARNELASQLDQHQQQVSEQAEQETANRLRETREFAEKNISGWNEEMDKKIVGFASGELGLKIEMLANAISPNLYRTLHLAWIGHQAIQRASVVPKPQQVKQPLRVNAGKTNSGSTKDPADMTMAEYAAWSEKKFSRQN